MDFTEFIEYATPTIQKELNRWSGLHTETEDLMQEVLIVVWQKYEEISGMKYPLAYVSNIARNVCKKTFDTEHRQLLFVTGELKEYMSGGDGFAICDEYLERQRRLSQERYQRNKEHIKARNAEYRKTHPYNAERQREYSKMYYYAHREELIKKQRENYRARTRTEAQRAKAREAAKRYYQKHREAIRAKQAEYRQKRRETCDLSKSKTTTTEQMTL